MGTDINKVIDELDAARSILNDARNIAEELRRGQVAGIEFTPVQVAALRTRFLAAIHGGESRIAGVEVEALK